MTAEEEKKVDDLIQEKLEEKEKQNLKDAKDINVPSTITESYSPTTKIEMPNYVPQIDKTKELGDQASDVVQLMGAQKASTNEDFMDEVAKKFQTGVLTEQETKNMQKQRLLEQEYFLKWQSVLEFIFIKQAHGLHFMRIMTIVAMLVYIPTRLIGMVVKSIGLIGDFINEIFNSIFGGKGHYLKDKDGNPVIDPTTKKPYIEKQGYNLFAKLLFGIIIGGLAIALVFVFIKIFTGFSVFSWFREIL